MLISAGKLYSNTAVIRLCNSYDLFCQFTTFQDTPSVAAIAGSGNAGRISVIKNNTITKKETVFFILKPQIIII